MSISLFAEMKTFVSFTQADAQALDSLRELLAPSFGSIVDLFYKKILQDDRTKEVLSASHVPLKQLKKTLYGWLEGLFCGRYDQSYYDHRCKIGRIHVEIHLPQLYMFTAMNVIRLAFEERIGELRLPDAPIKIAAIHKILDLDLAIMNETYREDMIRKIRDVEHSQYEQKLSESEHMASIGQLAASLAHEIKNPLAGISGAIQVLRSSMAIDHPHQEVIAEVLRQIDRLDAAVKDLLIYARPKPPERVRINFRHLLDRAMLLLREEPAFRNIHPVCQDLDHDCIVEVDEMQIQQVISNLMLNAAHACKPGGHVECKVRSNDRYIRVIIKDDGIGISPQNLPRVFEPFYTTKSRGTGLGLPICKRIIEAHGGILEIESQPSLGTSVTFEIPVRK